MSLKKDLFLVPNDSPSNRLGLVLMNGFRTQTRLSFAEWYQMDRLLVAISLFHLGDRHTLRQTEDLNLRIGTTTSVTCGCLFRLSMRYSKPTEMCLNGLKRKEINMERYRIIRGEGCNGCIPIIIYWVQVRKDKRISYEWVNVKGFDTYKRAKELLNVLKG